MVRTLKSLDQFGPFFFIFLIANHVEGKSKAQSHKLSYKPFNLALLAITAFSVASKGLLKELSKSIHSILLTKKI